MTKPKPDRKKILSKIIIIAMLPVLVYSMLGMGACSMMLFVGPAVAADMALFGLPEDIRGVLTPEDEKEARLALGRLPEHDYQTLSCIFPFLTGI